MHRCRDLECCGKGVIWREQQLKPDVGMLSGCKQPEVMVCQECVQELHKQWSLSCCVRCIWCAKVGVPLDDGFGVVKVDRLGKVDGARGEPAREEEQGDECDAGEGEAHAACGACQAEDGVGVGGEAGEVVKDGGGGFGWRGGWGLRWAMCEVLSGYRARGTLIRSFSSADFMRSMSTSLKSNAIALLMDPAVRRTTRVVRSSLFHHNASVLLAHDMVGIDSVA